LRFGDREEVYWGHSLLSTSKDNRGSLENLAPGEEG